MPLTIPEYITVKTAAGAVAAYLSPEADGLKDCFMGNELNNACTLALSLPLSSGKWLYLSDGYRIYAPDITGKMRVFVIQNPDAIERKRDGRKLWGQVTAHESWVLLGKKYATVSNDPQTPSPPALAVIILSGGSDLSGGLYPVGSAGHALYALLQGTGWSVGTVDVTGIHDLETEKETVLANVQKVQEAWGGYLVWDSVAKTVSLRDETLWAPYTGYQIRYRKNEKSITRTSDYSIVTRLYPFGENDLSIGSVNGGQLYIENYSYTAEILEGIWVNQDLADPQEVKDQAAKYLATVCKPRHNYRAKHVDLRLKPGFQHEDYDLGHLTDLIDEELSVDDRARIIKYKFNVFQPWNPDLEVGDPIKKIEATLLESMQAAKYLDSIKTSKGQITAYKLVNESLIAEKIAKAAVDATKLNTKVVVLVADTWTDNSPAAGSVAWNQHKLYYAGVEHIIVAGNTAQKYIYWDGVANTYSASADMPTLTDGQFVIAMNNGGLHDTVWDKGYAREFIGSVLIAQAAILSEHVGLAQILDAHIANLNANKITTGQLLAYLVEIVGKNGYFRINGDELLVYDKSGALMGRFGHYETLAALLAAFTRASTAYDDYGNLIASGVPRYLYMALPGPVWQDLFDADLLAAEYTSGGDVAGTPTVSGGVLTYTGGTQATLLKKDLLLQDCDIVVNSDQADNAGIVARCQDNNNYYLLAMRDASGVYPNTMAIFKRVGGTLTQLAAANIAWTRGTSKQIEFICEGSRLEAWFDGVKVIEKIDTTFTGGAVGLRNNSATAFRVLDFSVFYVQKGAMSEEGCTNIIATWPTGWTVSGDVGMAAVDQGVQPGAALNTVRLTNSGTTEGFYNSPTFALSPSTVYALRIKARGTVGAGKFDAYVLSSTGTFVQKEVTGIAVTGAFQVFSYTFTTSADITGINQAIRFDHNGNDAGYIEIAEVELIQKAYPLTFPGYGATRAAEVLTVPSSVFTKSNWTVKLEFTPTSEQVVAGRFAWLWEIYIDASNYYRLFINPSGQIGFDVKSGGVNVSIADSAALVVGQPYSLMLAGNGSVMRLCKNGAQVGVDTAYVEPVGTLPTNMYVGCDSGGNYQANGIFSDFAVLNQPETLADHQADYATGLPLTVDDATTYLMSCDGTLQPTVRGFGLWSKNGRFILVDPATGQGIEVWDGATRKVLIGRLDDGTIGGEFSGCGVYSSTVQTGAKGATTYIGLMSDGTLLAKVNGYTILRSEAGVDDGNLYFGKAADGVTFGRIKRYTDAYTGLGVESTIAGEILSLRSAGDIDVNANGGVNDITLRGDTYCTGVLTAFDKLCTEKTSQGVVGLFTRESPEQRYIDEGRAELVNGQCIIDLLELAPLPECIEQESDLTKWHVHLTPIGKFTPCVIEIYDSYVAVASLEPGVNGKFTWSLSATRIGKTGVRFPRMEWLVGGDEESDPILTTNWEDELLSGV